jgi:class 3 adenylate cyclase/tetratricopeptide (TPR) repeat protein
LVVSGAAPNRPLKLFINYRRTDVAGHAGRLFDALSQQRGVAQVFLDRDTIPVGVDFARFIRESIDGCDTVLALIGRGWADARDRDGRRRIEQPDDYVRLELEAAFAHRIPILPILLQDAEMPPESALPPSIAALARLNALELSDRRWRRDIEVLYETLGITPIPDDAIGSSDDEAHAPGRDVRKLVSVVLAEISARGPESERDPEAMDSARRRYCDGATTAVARHGGVIEPFLGDAVVGIFGVPIAHEDDALRATRAASELVDLARGGTLRISDDVDDAFDVRVVVLTDETVIRSDPGNAVRAGDLVSRALRLQRLAEPDAVVLSDMTFRLVQSGIEAEVVPSADGAARAYRLGRVRRVDETVPPRAVVPLIGRDRELTLVRNVLDECIADDTCALVTLLGDAGIGKTRVVSALGGYLGDSARVVIGRCASYGEGVAFLPVAQIIEALAELERGDSHAVVRAKLDALGERFDLPQVAAVGLARLVGDAPPAGEIEETFWSFRSMLEGFARERPLVVVFEDLHWADESVFEIIEHVSEWSNGAPLVLVATARPDLLERRPEWAGGRRQTTTRTLKPLGPGAAKDLLEALPHGASLPDNLAGRVLDVAGGVPLFVEEVLSELVERTVATTDGASNVVLPESLTALLESRIDQLTAAERTVLQCASIVGDSVSIPPLTALTEMDEVTVVALVTALLRRDILSVVEGDERHPRTVQCRHALLREAAHRSLTKQERATLHEKFVTWLDADPTTAGAPREALVARQLELAITASRDIGRVPPADAVSRATTAFHAIIDDAIGRGRATNELLSRVEHLAERDPTMRARLGPRLASALADNGDCDRAEAIVSGWSGDDAGSVQWQLAEAALLTARLSTGDDAAATTILDRLAAAEPALEPADEIEALIHRGFLQSQFGKRAAALADFTRAADIARDQSLTYYEIRALRHLITSAAYGPTRVDEVERILQRASTRMEALGSKPAAIARVAALLAAWRGDADIARAELQRYFDLEQAYGLSRYLADQGQDVCDIEWWAGDLDAAEAALVASDKQLRQMGADNYRTTVLAQLARVLARRGRLDEALVAASESERLVEPYDADSLVLLWSAYANAYARSGRVDDAIRAGERAVAVDTDCLVDHAEALLSLGEALARADRIDDALERVRDAVECLERKGARSPLHHARVVLDRLETAREWPS